MNTARELTHQLAALYRKETSAMADFLVALADFDRNERWRELNHTSLFYFLRRELGLSAGAAQARKTAVGLIQRVPEVEAALREGQLCLTTINELAKVLTPENRADVLPRFFGLSRSDAEELAVSIRPVPVVPVRDVIVAVRPAAAPTVAHAEPVRTATTDADATGSFRLDETARHSAPISFRLDETLVTEVKPEEPTPASAPVVAALRASSRDAVQPLDAERYRLRTTISRRFKDKLDAARAALSHSIPDGSLEAILERGLDLVLAEHAKRNGVVENPRSTPRPAESDAIPAHVKRAVQERAGGRCECLLESGERCGSTWQLEYDHVVARARGGKATLENVRLACRAHNVAAARRAFWRFGHGPLHARRTRQRSCLPDRGIPIRRRAGAGRRRAETVTAAAGPSPSPLRARRAPRTAAPSTR